MARRSALTLLMTALGVAVLLFAASVLTAAVVTALAGWSKDLATVVVIAGVVTAAGIVTAAALDE